MAVEVRPVVLARRPLAEVAAFIFDPGSGLSWTGGITSNRPTQPKPLLPGARAERTATFPGGYSATATFREPTGPSSRPSSRTEPN
jgi:hypothetical protein